MISSQRKEHFRFSFSPPLNAAFCIVKIGTESHWKNVKSSIGSAKVLDISPAGLKIETVLDIPVDKPIVLQLTFAVNDQEFVLTGRVRWQQRRGQSFHYGISLEVSSDKKQEIIDEVKKYSKKLYFKNPASAV